MSRKEKAHAQQPFKQDMDDTDHAALISFGGKCWVQKQLVQTLADGPAGIFDSVGLTPELVAQEIDMHFVTFLDMDRFLALNRSGHYDHRGFSEKVVALLTDVIDAADAPLPDDMRRKVHTVLQARGSGLAWFRHVEPDLPQYIKIRPPRARAAAIAAKAPLIHVVKDGIPYGMLLGAYGSSVGDENISRNTNMKKCQNLIRDVAHHARQHGAPAPCGRIAIVPAEECHPVHRFQLREKYQKEAFAEADSFTAVMMGTLKS